MCAVEAVNDHELAFILSFLLSERNQSFILQIMITVRRRFVRDTKSNDTSLKFYPRLHSQTFTAIHHKKADLYLYFSRSFGECAFGSVHSSGYC